jgi:hypothetical protein
VGCPLITKSPPARSCWRTRRAPSGLTASMRRGCRTFSRLSAGCIAAGGHGGGSGQDGRSAAGPAGPAAGKHRRQGRRPRAMVPRFHRRTAPGLAGRGCFPETDEAEIAAFPVRTGPGAVPYWKGRCPRVPKRPPRTVYSPAFARFTPCRQGSFAFVAGEAPGRGDLPPGQRSHLRPGPKRAGSSCGTRPANGGFGRGTWWR